MATDFFTTCHKSQWATTTSPPSSLAPRDRQFELLRAQLAQGNRRLNDLRQLVPREPRLASASRSRSHSLAPWFTTSPFASAFIFSFTDPLAKGFQRESTTSVSKKRGQRQNVTARSSRQGGFVFGSVRQQRDSTFQPEAPVDVRNPAQRKNRSFVPPHQVILSYANPFP
ncbi:hypothetical protein KCU71_g1583, partial [Aureobasidium melanogenum]